MRVAITLIAFLVAHPAAAAEVSRFVSNEQGFAVNSWLVPTKTGIVVIDTQFTVPEADKLADAVKQTGKPLKAVVITHPHPDHYNGTCRLLQSAKVPIYATQATIDGIHATAEAKRTQWKPTYGKDYPDSTCVPDHVLPVRGTVQIDGVKFQSRDYGPGEALTESIVLAPSLRAAFVGDVIYDRVHPWLAEGRSTQWLQQLDRLQEDVPAEWIVYPGHGASSGVAVIGAQRRYIMDFREQTKARLGPAGLNDDSAKALVDATRAQYPGWPLEMLIPINAGAVAKELSAAGVK
jgi:glyoxylase-like metal-dependent hydrolase (beta-lactamase superfamily II)